LLERVFKDLGEGRREIIKKNGTAINRALPRFSQGRRKRYVKRDLIKHSK